MAIRILHILSNWKWTERSEPCVDLALAEQVLGADVRLVCDQWSNYSKNAVSVRAHSKGLKSVTPLHLPKHFNLPSVPSDVLRLRKLMKAFDPHVVHFHMPNAHLLGALASVSACSFRSVRSCYDPSGPKKDLRSRWLYSHHTDGLVVINQQAKSRASEIYNFTDDNLLIAEPGIDLGRFFPKRNPILSRREFGLSPDAFILGVVSRIRRRRRIDIPLEAVRILAENFPQIRLLIAGRGQEGAAESIVQSPARAMGIADKIILAGYCRGERLVAAYQAMDVLVYPTPGTDQTCRTVREALASGVPVIAPKIGFLPELLEDGINGRFIELSAQGLAGTLGELIKNPERLRQMAANATEGAKERFSTHRQARKVLAFYEKLLCRSTS